MKDTPAVDETLLRQLPPVLRAVVQALGFARAQEFLGLCGGLPVYVPKIKISLLCLDAQETERLIDALENHLDSTRRIFFPKADGLFRQTRNRQIKAERKSHSIAALARKNNLTTRHVLNICCEEPPPPQLDLFDAGG